MLKQNYIILLLLFIFGATFGQGVSYEYFKNNWKKTSKKKAYIIRTIKQLDNALYFVSDSTVDGMVKRTGYYKSLSPEIEHGEFIFAFNDLDDIYTGNYTNGELTGVWYISDLQGNKKDSINYDFELPVVEFKVDSMKKDNDKNKWVTIDEMPEFRYGPPESFSNYLRNYMKYPPRALLYGISGVIYCQFTVDKTGQVVNIEVMNKLDKDLEKETLRVVANSPLWKPAQHEGKLVGVRFTMPLAFRLKK